MDDNLGDAYILQDKYDEALTYYSKALEVQRHVEPRNPQALASFNNSIGNVYNKMHRYGDALTHFKRALECYQEYLPPTHPSFASLYNNIGSIATKRQLIYIDVDVDVDGNEHEHEHEILVDRFYNFTNYIKRVPSDIKIKSISGLKRIRVLGQPQSPIWT